MIGYPLSVYISQWQRLDQLLTKFTSLWQVQAFECDDLPWKEQFPELANKVWQLDDNDLDAIDADQAKLNAVLLPVLVNDAGYELEEFIFDEIPQLFQKHSALQHQGLTEANPPLLSEECESHFSAHIKGRKWQQINAFVKGINQQTQGMAQLPVLEWCAGKGHLGRLIAKSADVPVVSLEWQQTLCDAGQAFADKWHLPQHFMCADAFNLPDEMRAKTFLPVQHAVALHACGDLHVELLQHVAKVGTQAVSISPCCYHLIQAKQYQPLSELAKGSGLRLSRQDLRLPLQQSVIASPAQQKLRHKEVAWRLGFDSLQRAVSGRSSYLPIPSLKQSQLSGGFADFCHWAANAKSVVLPEGVDYDYYLTKGIERQRLTRRVDLVAHLFREVLERWLLLDRVCYLHEQGYRVHLSTFCSHKITPRNALIYGERADK